MNINIFLEQSRAYFADRRGRSDQENSDFAVSGAADVAELRQAFGAGIRQGVHHAETATTSEASQ